MMSGEYFTTDIPEPTTEIEYFTTDILEPIATDFSDFPREAVGSVTELACIVSYMIVCIVSVLGGNGAIMVAVFKHQSLHTPHYFLLCSYAMCDVGMCLFGYPIIIAIVFQGTDVPEWSCRLSGCLGIACFFSSIYFLGLLAFERYHFFVHPLSYDRNFSTPRIACMVAGVWFITLSFCITTEVTLGRKLYLTVMGCQLENSALMSQLQIIGFFGPSLVLILFSTARVLVLRKRMKVAPQQQYQSEANQYGNSESSGAKISQAVVSFRLVLLISGLFWATYLPNFFARLVIFSSGVTWDEIESRENLMAMVVLRTSHMVMATVSAGLNPWIYLFTHRDLRIAVRRLVGMAPTSRVADVSLVN